MLDSHVKTAAKQHVLLSNSVYMPALNVRLNLQL